MLFPAFDDSAKHVDAEYNPYQRNGNIYRPFQLRIFFTCGKAKEECYSGRCYNELPSPEMDPAKPVAEHPGLAQPLKRIINTRKNTVAYKGKDDRIGM